MPARSHIGLEIGATEFRLVELRSDGEGAVLAYAKVQQTEYNYGTALIHDAPYNRKIAKAFIRDLTTLFTNTPLQATRISVTIPSSSLLVATIPVDARVSPPEKREHLQWECRTLYGLDADVAIDTRSVVLRSTEDADYHLVAAMPAQTNEFFRSVFQQMDYNVSELEIHHFVIENCIEDRIAKSDTLTYGVIGLYEEFCTVGVYGKGTYRGFSQGTVSFNEGYFAQVLRQVQQVMEHEPETNLQAVFTYGSATTEPLLDSLRALLKIPVTKFDPMEGMPFLTPDVSRTVSSYAAHVFDVPVSAALLGLQQ